MPRPAFTAVRLAADFAGAWRLAAASDGKRTREDLDELLSLGVVADSLEIQYRIPDRFGTRELSLRAPLDGTSLVQLAQSRRAVVSARLVGEQLCWKSSATPRSATSATGARCGSRRTGAASTHGARTSSRAGPRIPPGRRPGSARIEVPAGRRDARCRPCQAGSAPARSGLGPLAACRPFEPATLTNPAE
jgi:hypothetical protein